MVLKGQSGNVVLGHDDKMDSVASSPSIQVSSLPTVGPVSTLGQVSTLAFVHHHVETTDQLSHSSLSVHQSKPGIMS